MTEEEIKEEVNPKDTKSNIKSVQTQIILHPPSEIEVTVIIIIYSNKILMSMTDNNKIGNIIQGQIGKNPLGEKIYNSEVLLGDHDNFDLELITRIILENLEAPIEENKSKIILGSKDLILFLALGKGNTNQEFYKYLANTGGNLIRSSIL